MNIIETIKTLRKMPFNDNIGGFECWRLRRRSWYSDNFLRMRDNITANEDRAFWNPSSDDLVAEDWEIPPLEL